jgi:germination protein M
MGVFLLGVTLRRRRALGEPRHRRAAAATRVDCSGKAARAQTVLSPVLSSGVERWRFAGRFDSCQAHLLPPPALEQVGGRSRRHNHGVRVLPVLMLALVLAAGCGGNGGNGPPAQPPAAEPSPGEPIEPPLDERDPVRVTVYFMRGEEIGAASRELEPTEQVGRVALEALLEGPTGAERQAGLSSEIPEGTRLLGLSIDGEGHALVDLSQAFESGGGSLSMQARVAQVVFTLTQFPTVEQVTFRLDGRDVEGIGGEGVAPDRRSRDDFEDLSPAILLESPAVGDRVAGPLRIRGTANTFEATFMVTLADTAGRVLYENFVTATSGSGVRGTFDATLSFELDGSEEGTLTVWEESAVDGSRTNVVEVPLELAGP